MSYTIAHLGRYHELRVRYRLLLIPLLAVPAACQSVPAPVATTLPAPTATVPVAVNPTAPLPSATLTRSPLPPDWQSRWLKGIPCRPPCWEGITPGQTTAAEAIEVLTHNGFVTNVRESSESQTPKMGLISWEWLDGQRGGYLYYRTDTSTHIIDSIYPIYIHWFDSREVVQALGEPSHVIAHARQGADIGSGVFYSVWFIYLPQGLVLESIGGSAKPNLENFWLYPFVFFTPARESLKKNLSIAEQHPDWVLEWQGFKGFDYYCRDLSNGIECKGK